MPRIGSDYDPRVAARVKANERPTTNRVVSNGKNTTGEKRICPSCELEIGVRKDGTLRDHRVGSNQRNAYLCPGEKLTTEQLETNEQQTRVESKKARQARGRRDPSVIPHGTLGGYISWGCRCDICRGAEKKYRDSKK